ncbi:MAG: hypothetical protein ACHQUC_10830 [Chlamydiales bacterium]
MQQKIYCYLGREIEQLSSDFLYHDVPAMRLNLINGTVFHHALGIKVYDQPLIDIIRNRIVNPPEMSAYFWKELNNYTG